MSVIVVIHAMVRIHSASILVEATTVTALLDTQEMGSSAQVSVVAT